MKSLALIVAVILVLVPVSAQQPQGVLSGIVLDVSGMVLPGVTVEVTGPDPGAKPRVVVTDSQGRYSLSDLTPGAYSVSFRLTGFRTLTRNFVTVSASLPTNLDVSLHVGPLAETFSSGVRFHRARSHRINSRFACTARTRRRSMRNDGWRRVRRCG